MSLLERETGRRRFLKGAGAGGFGLLVAACSGSGKRQKDQDPADILNTPQSVETPQITATQTAESSFIESPRAVIDLGNWEISVVGWEKFDKVLSSSKKKPEQDMNSKLLAVQIIARNISNELLE